MFFTWFGQSCFRIQGKEVSLVTDPFEPASTGLRLPRVQADIITISHDHKDHNYSKGIGGKPFIIKTPGEFEIRNVFVTGIPSDHDASGGSERGANTIFVIDFEEIRIVHLGDLGTSLTDDQMKQIGNADILLIPVGGTYTLDAKKAAEVVNQMEPRIVIPMHYKLPKLKYKLAPVETFCKEMGTTVNGAESKFRIVKKDLPVDETKIQLLTP